MRNFSARETEWLLELDGIELATFSQRALAICIDGVILGFILSVIASLTLMGVLWARTGSPFNVKSELNHLAIHVNSLDDKHAEEFVHKASPYEETIKIGNDIIIPVLYFGILLWKGKGRTPGKRLMKIRVVSLMHRHITLWHAIERALGYGAAALEGGFGFVQFFIHPYRRCAQDRLAETIVVTERGYQAMQHKLAHPLIPDTPATINAPE